MTSSTFAACTGPLGWNLTLAQVGIFNLDGTSYADGVTTGDFSNISLATGGTCSVTLTGSLDLKYSNITHKLSLAPVSGSGHSLIAHVTGGGTTCFNLIHDGDIFQMTTNVSYTVTTPLGNLSLTSP